MKIIEKMREKAADNRHCEGVTIGFLGDSVTQGCFELYKVGNDGIQTVFDRRHSYSTVLSDLLALLFPTVPVSIINAGISGDSSTGGAARVQNDLLRHQPDLVVVCYGLNDCSKAEGGIPTYTEALNTIFTAVQSRETEVIFMTPNMMNTRISPHLTDAHLISIAREKAELQNEGYMDRYMEAARAVCGERGIPVCDCYAIWKKLSGSGVNTTELFANQINHPSREMVRLFAAELLRTMFYF